VIKGFTAKQHNLWQSKAKRMREAKVQNLSFSTTSITSLGEDTGYFTSGKLMHRGQYEQSDKIRAISDWNSKVTVRYVASELSGRLRSNQFRVLPPFMNTRRN